MKAQTIGGLAELSLSVPVNALASVLKSIDESTETAEVSLTLPKKELARVMKAISLTLSEGHEAREVNEDGEELYSSKEVFPEGDPAMALRGLRGKEELTQEDFAKRLGITQHRVSEMESGKRPISKEMAKRIGRAFNVSYKAFL